MRGMPFLKRRLPKHYAAVGGNPENCGKEGAVSYGSCGYDKAESGGKGKKRVL